MAHRIVVAYLCSAALLVSATVEAGDADKRFDVWEYRVEGNSVLDQRSIESTLYPFLGESVDLARVEAARAALEAVYRERGFVAVSVSIPEQTVDDGFVKLVVVEQKVARLRVTGAKYNSERSIAAALPALAPGTVLNTNDVQTDLNELSRRSRDVSYDPRIKSGKDVGTLDVEVAVKDELPLHGSMELNNFRSANTSDLRLAGTVSYANLFQRQDTIVLSSQVSPQDTNQVKVFSGTYVMRPESLHAIFSFTGVHTDSDVAAVGGTTVLGKGDFYFARGIFPLRESGPLNDSLQVGLDYKDSTDKTTFSVDEAGGSRVDVTDKAITYMNLVLGYTASIADPYGDTSLDFTGNFGSRQLFNGASEFEQTRFKGAPNYVHLNFDLTRNQPLPLFGMHLTGRLRSQWSPDPLIANEQMNLGGFTSVRGYLEAEDLGDYGLNTSVELVSPDFAARLPRVTHAEVYGFWDWGVARLNDPLPDEISNMILASLGIGVRMTTAWGMDAQGVWAHALRNGSETPSGDDRVLFTVGYQF